MKQLEIMDEINKQVHTNENSINSISRVFCMNILSQISLPLDNIIYLFIFYEIKE